MGEADCDIGISLYRSNIYRPRALVVALEVTPLSDQTRPQHPSPGSLQASLRGVVRGGYRGPVISIGLAIRRSGRAAFQLNIRRSFLSSSC
jgi:hypothetical protein